MKNKKILIIDDEPQIRELLESYLKEKGFLTLTTKDGVEALKKMEGDLPHLIICDLLLPEEHGINIIETIKKRYFLPIIIISGVYKKKELKESMQTLMVEAFLEKPIDLNVLYEKICELLEK